MSLPAADATLLVETARVRVTEYALPPGSATGHHRHGLDYVIVPVTGGTLTIVGATGTMSFELRPGAAYAREAGVEHDVQNLTAEPIRFVEVELK